MIRGSVVYLYAFDVASEIHTREVQEVLSAPATPFHLRPATALPKDVRIHQPLVIGIPTETAETNTPSGTAPLSCIVKVYEIGALSITYQVPFQVGSLAELTVYHALRVGGRELSTMAEELCDRVSAGLQAALQRPTPADERSPAEAYTIFCIEALDGEDAASLGAWSERCRPEIAALLTEEPPGRLSDEQVADTTRLWLRYTKADLAVVDWDAALLVDLRGEFEDVLFVIELANLQLEQFRILDDRLDAATLRAYDDLERHYRSRPLLRVPTRILADLRTIRVDLTKMSEEAGNITKFVGDWYLARVYLASSERFHLGHWQASVARTIGELDDLYSLVRSEIEARRMLVLEVTIVALFVLDLVLLVWKG